MCLWGVYTVVMPSCLLMWPTVLSKMRLGCITTGKSLKTQQEWVELNSFISVEPSWTNKWETKLSVLIELDSDPLRNTVNVYFKTKTCSRWEMETESRCQWGVTIVSNVSSQEKKKNTTYQESTRKEAKGWKDKRAHGFFWQFRNTKKFPFFSKGQTNSVRFHIPVVKHPQVYTWQEGGGGTEQQTWAGFNCKQYAAKRNAVNMYPRWQTKALCPDLRCVPDTTVVLQYDAKWGSYKIKDPANLATVYRIVSC